MKWMVMVALVAVFVASSAIAGGDQNRGDKGKGNVHQEQVRNS